MSEEIIESYIDRGKFKSDTDFVVSEIERAKTAYESLSKSKINIQSSKPLTDVSAGIKEAEKATQALLKTQIQLVAVKKAQVQLENELLKQKKLQLDIDERLTRNSERQAKVKPTPASPISVSNIPAVEIQRTGTAVNALDLAQAEAANSATAMGNANIVASKSTKEVTKSAHELNKELELKKQLEKQAQQELKNTVREENAVKGSLEQRRAALIRLNAVYDNQGPAERASAAGQRLQKIISGLDLQVKTLESTTGRSQRNVGNYASAFDKVKDGAGKAFSALRTLANIIPGLGIGGIFLLGYEGIKAFASAVVGVQAPLFDFKEKLRVISEIYKTTAESAGKEIAQLKIQRAEIESANVPMATKLQIIKDIKKEYPEYFNGLTNEQILAGQVGDAYDKASAAIIRKAKANAAAGEIEKLASQQLALDFKIQQAEEKAANDAKNAKDQVITRVGTGDNAGTQRVNTADAQKAGIKIRLNVEKKAAEDEKKIIKDKFDFLLKFLELGAKETVKISAEKTKPAKKDGSLQALKELLNTEFEQYKINQKRIIQSYEDRANGEKEAGRLTELTYSERIDALNKYSTAVLELNKKQEQEDIANKEREAKREIDRLNEEKKGKDPTQIARINENIKIVESNLQQSLALIRTDAFDKRIDIYKNNEKKFDDITKQFNDKRIDEIKKQNEAEAQEIEDGINTSKAKLDTDYADAIQSLNQRFTDGKISQKQYNKERKKLDDEYRLASLEAEIKYTKEVLNLMQARGIDVKKELAVLANLEIQYSDTKKKLRDDDAKETLEMLNEIQSYYTQISGVISSALNAAATTRKNEIQEEIDLIDKRKEADLAANDARVQSDQDRAANAIVINARAQAQKEQLERKQKQIDQQKARADKALTIFQITLSTAKAIVKAAPDPFEIAFAAAIGAAQLAIAIATPIPKFKHGKNVGNNYEGLGIVNDGPKMEAIERADGSIEFPQGRDVLTYVGKNDIIHPDKDVWLNAILNAAHRDANASMRFIPESKKDNSLSIAMKKQTQLLQQIANKKELNLSAKQGGMEALWKWGSNQTKYVNENTNWQ